jgi:hypothetical protein
VSERCFCIAFRFTAFKNVVVGLAVTEVKGQDFYITKLVKNFISAVPYNDPEFVSFTNS